MNPPHRPIWTLVAALFIAWPWILAALVAAALVGAAALILTTGGPA